MSFKCGKLLNNTFITGCWQTELLGGGDCWWSHKNWFKPYRIPCQLLNSSWCSWVPLSSGSKQSSNGTA